MMKKIAVRFWNSDYCIWITKTGPRGGERHMQIAPPTAEARDELVAMLKALELPYATPGFPPCDICGSRSLRCGCD